MDGMCATCMIQAGEARKMCEMEATMRSMAMGKLSGSRSFRWFVFSVVKSFIMYKE